MARERYWRAYAGYCGFEVSLGLEIRDIDTRPILQGMGMLLDQVARDHTCQDDNAVKAIERWLNANYPGRAYFIETEYEKTGVQVFDPRDFIKERCECPCVKSSPGVTS